MYTLVLEETFNGLAKANGMRWHGHVTKRNSNDTSIRKKTFVLNWLKEEGVDDGRLLGKGR